MEAHSKKALIIKLGAIGDIVMTIPAVRALYEQGFQIHWVCGKSVRGLLECYSWIKPIPVDDASILKGSPLRRAINILGLWNHLARTKWDLVATLYYDPRYRFLTFPLRSERKVALSNQSRETNLVGVRSYSDEFARIMLGTRDNYRPHGLAPLRPDRLPPSPMSPTTAVRRIAIVPGGTSNLMSQQTLRRWPIESYVTVALELRRRGWEVVLVGGSDDAWVRKYFEGTVVIDFLGKSSLPEVVSLFDSCDGVISHDTGPMHLAGMSFASLVAIFGPTNPGHFLPRRSAIVGIWGGQEYACRPCYDLRSFPQCEWAGCVREVTPEMVLSQLDLLLEARSRGVAEPWQILSPTSRLVRPC